MDPPPPDGFNPYSLEDGSQDGVGDGEYSEHGGNQDDVRKAANNRPQRPGRKATPEGSELSQENSMPKRIFDFCLSLIAPPRDASPEELRRNLISLSVAIAGIYVVLGIAYGFGESIGLKGFARADTVEQMQRENTDFRVSFYSLGIREFHHAFCNASTTQDQLLLNNQLERLRAGYQKEVGVAYVLPPCPVKTK